MMMKHILMPLLSVCFLSAPFGAFGDDQDADDTDEFDVSEEILSIKGDPEYGEYLSGDCTGCHQVDGSYDGIPSITGWDEESFVWAMHSYKEKAREHPVMQMMAGRLSNDEIAALAAYFATLE